MREGPERDAGVRHDLLATRLSVLSARCERFAARVTELEMRRREQDGKLNQLADELAAIRYDVDARLAILERWANSERDD